MDGNAPSVRAVIFDLDGTLLDTLDDLATAVNFALRSCGFPERSRDEVRTFVGNGVVRLIQRAAPQDLAPEEWQRCFDTFRAYYLAHLTDRTRPYPQILPLLNALRLRGVKTAVVSNKLHAGVVGLCRSFFGDRLCCVFGVTEDGERKPAPVTALRAMRTMGTDPRSTLFVGDSEVDVRTAENAGLPCVGVSWGFRTRGELERAGAVAVIDRPLSLLELLDEGIQLK